MRIKQNFRSCVLKNHTGISLKSSGKNSKNSMKDSKDTRSWRTISSKRRINYALSWINWPKKMINCKANAIDSESVLLASKVHWKRISILLVTVSFVMQTPRFKIPHSSIWSSKSSVRCSNLRKRNSITLWKDWKSKKFFSQRKLQIWSEWKTSSINVLH